MRGGEAGDRRGGTRAGTPFNKQSDDGMTSPTADLAGAMAVTRAVGRFLLVQAVLLAASLALYGWTPWLLWIAAMATTFQLYLRVRNIAEHACTTTGSDEDRKSTRLNSSHSCASRMP